MSADLSSLNLTLLAQFLQASSNTRLQLEPTQRLMQNIKDNVAGRCAQPALGSIVSVPDAGRLLSLWESNDVGARAIHDALIVMPFSGSRVEVNTSVLDAAHKGTQVFGPHQGFTNEPAELVGFPRNSGFVDDPVCAANGNFLHGDRDFSTRGFGGLIDTIRLYNSMAAYRRGVFGWGWSSMLDMQLRIEDEAGIAWATLADGAITAFAPDSDGGWAVNGRRSLALTTTDTGWTLRHGQDEEWFFNTDGQLTGGRKGLASFSLHHGANRITVTEARSGRTVAYTLDATGLVTHARTGDGRVVTYDYTDGHCVAARRSIGDVTYEVSDGLIAAIFDADDVLFCRNTYDDGVAGRVLTQLSAHGRTTIYSYMADGVTVVGDTENGPRATFKHDERGNLIAMSGGSGVEARMTWDGMDRITTHVDRVGGETRYVYHPDASLNLLLARVDPDGLSEFRDFDDFGRVVRQRGRNGEITLFSYDSDESPTPSLIINPEGGRVVTTFGPDLLPTSVTDADGVTSHYMYDRDGQLVAAVNGAGDRTVFTYDKVGRSTKVTDPMGKTATFTHEESGQVREVTTVDGGVQRYTYSDAGRVLTCLTDGPGTFTATYGEHGDITTMADALGATLGYDYDTHGNLITQTAPDGVQYGFEYDAELNLIAKTAEEGNWATQEFDAAGRSLKVSTSDGEIWTRTVDSFGRTTSLAAVDGSTTRWTYHPEGEVASFTNSTGEVFQFDIDELGRLIRETDPDGNEATYEYTPGGRLHRHTTAAGRLYRLSYDAAGRLVKVSDADDIDVTTEFRPDGQVGRLSGPQSTVDLTYDDAGRITTWSNSDGVQGSALEWEADRTTFSPADTAVAVFERDPRGLLSNVTDAAGITTTFAHDVRGRITGSTTRTIEREATTSVTFDPSGVMGSVTDPMGVTTTISNSPSGRPLTVDIGTPADNIGWAYTYDEMRRVTAIAGADGTQLVTYNYDEQGHRIGATNRHGSIAMNRDRHGRIESVQNVDGLVTRYERDNDGVLTGRSDDTATTKYIRTPAGRLLAFQDSEAGLVPVPRVNPDSELTSAAGRLLGDRHGRVYNYDSAGRISEAVTANGERSAFTYNDFGFLATDITPLHGRRQFRYNAGGQLETIIADDGTTSEFSYDAAGRRTAERQNDGSRVRYWWNDLNQLTRIIRISADGSTTTREVAYSGLNRPERVDDTTIGWDDAISGKPTQIGSDRYLRSGTMFRRVTPGASWFDGTVEDPWGDFGHQGIDLGYRGELTIDNLVFMGARVYDPATRTFLSRDPLPSVAGANTYSGGYAYAWNDPINYLDPSGLSAVSMADFQEWKEDQERSTWGSISKPFVDDPWGTIGMIVVVGVGVALVSTGVGGPIGAGILISAAANGAIGVNNGTFDPRSVAVAGAFGGLPGGAGMSIPRSAAVAFGVGATEDYANQVIVQGRELDEISWSNMLTGGLFNSSLNGITDGVSGLAEARWPAPGPSGVVDHGVSPTAPNGRADIDQSTLDLSGATPPPATMTPDLLSPPQMQTASIPVVFGPVPEGYTRVFRGTSITYELQVQNQTGLLMSDAGRVGFGEGAESLDWALVASEQAHVNGVEAWGGLDNYIEAHGEFGSEITAVSDRSMISVTTDPVTAKDFAGPDGEVFVAWVETETLLPQTLPNAGEDEFLVPNMFQATPLTAGSD